MQINTCHRVGDSIKKDVLTCMCTHNAGVFKANYNSATASSTIIANMDLIIVLFGTLTTAVLLAEAIVSDIRSFQLLEIAILLGTLPVQLPCLWKM